MDSSPSPLIPNLHTLLQNLHDNPYPEVPNPPSCKKRASVALIIRIRPSHNCRPEPNLAPPPTSTPFSTCLSTFFSHPWVHSGSPEILFIRRAARHGDRWTSHVALPGGKRDPLDPSDQATSLRETHEETGLDLSSPSSTALLIGNLPERIVSATWDTVPLMVLCPFVYLLTTPHITPPLALQPAEVASAHWVPLRALLAPSLRTTTSCDISDRLARQGGGLLRLAFRAAFGQMRCGGIRLLPTESLHSPTGSEDDAGYEALRSSSESPLVLWGLTHGIVLDFLHLLPAHSATELWTWPTSSLPDARLVVWLMTYRFRRRKTQEPPRRTSAQAPLIIGEGVGVVAQPLDSDTGGEEKAGLGFGEGVRGSAVGQLLDGYWGPLRNAIAVAAALRVGVAATVMGYAILVWRRKGRRG